MIYETKGLSLEQVNELYENVSLAWKSPSYRSELRTLSVSEAHRRKSSVSEAHHRRSSVYDDTKPSEMAYEDASKV